MYSNSLSILQYFNRVTLCLFFLVVQAGCTSNNNSSLEIIVPPNFPDEFLKIPDSSKLPELQKLTQSKAYVESIAVGKKNPFSPSIGKSINLLLPQSFIYHGLIATKDSLGAFVTYQNQTGIIRSGDVGGDNTILLPNGWSVENIDSDEEILELSFDEHNIKLEIFE